MKAQHTPGPWFVSSAPGSKKISVWAKAGDVLVADCDSKSTALQGRRNDARLIAAAPELLEALRLALDHMESDWFSIDGEWGPLMEEFGDLEGAVRQCHKSTDAIRSARAAIAKATGSDAARDEGGL